MINLIKSLGHWLFGWHTGAVRICSDPLIMWCPVCKLAWHGGVHLVDPVPPPSPIKRRPVDS